MEKFCLTWIDRKTGKDVYKYVRFESEQKTKEYVEWASRETGRTITYKSTSQLY